MKYQEMLAFASFLNKSQGNDTEAWKKAMQSVNQLLEVMGPYQLRDGKGGVSPHHPAGLSTDG